MDKERFEFAQGAMALTKRLSSNAASPASRLSSDFRKEKTPS